MRCNENRMRLFVKLGISIYTVLNLLHISIIVTSQVEISEVGASSCDSSICADERSFFQEPFPDEKLSKHQRYEHPLVQRYATKETILWYDKQTCVCIYIYIK